jgi:hypothetical protein
MDLFTNRCFLAAATLFFADKAVANCEVTGTAYSEKTIAFYEGRQVECHLGQWQYPIAGFQPLGEPSRPNWQPVPKPLLAEKFSLHPKPSSPSDPPQPVVPLDQVQPNDVTFSYPLEESSPPWPASTPANLPESSAPPSTFEGAQNFGVLDQTRPTSQQTSHFPFFAATHTINLAIPAYTSKFYRFDIAHDAARLRVRLEENPPATLLVRLYDANRQKIHESLGNPHEQFEMDVPRGLYFLESLRLNSTECIPRGQYCINIGRLFIEAFPIPAPSDAGGSPALPLDLGSLAPNQRIEHQETLFRLYLRGGTSADGLRPPLPQTEFADIADYFTVYTSRRGRLSGGLSVPALNVHVMTEYGWATLPSVGIELPPGQKLIRVTNGQWVGNISFDYGGDIWADYKLVLGFN